MAEISVRLIGPIFDISGISQVNRETALALSSIGIPVQIVDMPNFCKVKAYLSPDILQKLKIMQATPLNGKYVAIHAYPIDAAKTIDNSAVANISWNVYETNKIPHIWQLILNNDLFKEVWTASEFNKQTFIDSGVKPEKIAVINQGVNTSIYRPGLKPLDNIREKGNFYFLFVSALKYCKGYDVLLRAFFDEFATDSKVKLIFKADMHSGSYDNEKAFIKSIIQNAKGKSKSAGEVLALCDNINEEFMARLYSTADCFVLPSRGEGWGMCLGPKTILHTKEDIFEIKDAKKNMEVLSLDGKYHKILDTTSRMVDSYYEVGFRGGLSTQVTSEHPFYTTKSSLKQYLKNKSELLWENISNIKTGDLLCVPKPKYDNEIPDTLLISELVSGIEKDGLLVYKKMGFSPKKELSYSKIVEKYNTTKKTIEKAVRYLSGDGCEIKSSNVLDLVKRLKHDGFQSPQPNKIKDKIYLNDEFLEFCGWYLAEGSLGAGDRIDIDLHKKEMYIAEKLKRWFDSEVGRGIAICEFNKKNSCRLRISSSIFAEFLNKIFGQHAHNKTIPWFIENGGTKLGPLIRGLFRGDGHFNKATGTIVFTTVSKNLAIKTRNILLANNIFALMSFSNSGTSGKYTLRISKTHLDRFNDFIGEERWKYQARGSRFIEENDYFLVPITFIKKINKQLEVFDICVDGTHNFMANGVLVHNTYIQSMACGVPVIATDCSAHTTFCNSENSLMVPAELKRIDNLEWLLQVPFQQEHAWFEPDYKKLREQMRWAYRNSDKLKTLGAKAREDVQKYDWQNIAMQIVAQIAKYA